MGWSGGTYTRTNGSNTGSTVWQQDEAGAVDIEADRHDTHDQDLADGINACLHKGGQNSMTANLDLGGFSFDNASAPVNFTEADAVDLADAGNALNVGGATSSAHLAMSAGIVQAKSNATTATDLGLQTLDGNLDLGAASSVVNIIGTGAVDLSDNGNSLNVGAEAGAHLAVSPAILQAKGSSTSAAALGINPLGGDVNIGTGSAATTVTGSLEVTHASGSAQILADAASGQDSVIGLQEAGATKGRLLYDASANVLVLETLSTGENIRIEDDTNVAALFDPAGDQQLYYDGNVALGTNSGGITVQDPDGTSPIININDNTATRQAYIFSTSAALSIVSEAHGAIVQLRGEDAGGTLRTIVSGDPDGAASIFHNGSERVSTTSGGVDIAGTLDASGFVTSTTAGATVSQPGTVELATEAEMFTGSDATRALTPASIGDSLSTGSGSGVIHLPGGLKLQWALSSSISDDSSGTVTWPEAWSSSSSYQVTCTPTLAPSGGADGWAVTALGTTTSTIWNDTDRTNTFRCIGIGT